MIKLMMGKVLDTGYVASQLGKAKLSDSKIEAWTQFYHKPYALDYAEARHKAYERKNRDAEEQSYLGGIR